MVKIIEFTKEERETLKNAIAILSEFAGITNNVTDHIKANHCIENINDILNGNREER